MALLLATCGVHGDKKPDDAVAKFVPEENGYAIVWEDNFDGDRLDETKWRHRLTGPRRIGYNDPAMVQVKDGNLMLIYDIKGDSICAGAIGTDVTFASTYGYYECRARLQQSKGPWAAFWLQSPLVAQGEDPATFGAEIDIFENNTHAGGDWVTHAVHWAYGPNQKSTGRMDSYLEGMQTGFHLFALEWTPEKYAFYIDGLKFHETDKGLSHVDEYIILSMEIPTTLEGIKQACAPDTFIVDYVRVYQREVE